MEDIKRINIDGKNYTFFCQSRGTRNGFAHDCRMVDADEWQTVAKATRHYLNRTWECWDFQSVIEDALENAMNAERDWIKNCTKLRNGWDRLTAKRRAILEEAYKNSAELVRLEKLHKEIGGDHPAWAS